MITSFTRGIIISLAVTVMLMMTGCGGGSSTTTTSSTTSAGGAGTSSKGPFKEGSTVVAYKLNSDGTRSATSASTITTDSKGSFSFGTSLGWTGTTEFVISGDYLNENTGTYMNLPSTSGLSCIVDLVDGSSVPANINVFTDIAAKAMKAKMAAGVSAATAKTEAQESVKKLFNLSDDVKLEELDPTDGSTNVRDNAQLLIVSSALLNTANPEDTLNKIGDDLSDGEVDDSAVASLDELEEKVANVDLATVAATIQDTVDGTTPPDDEDTALNGVLSLDNNISFTDTVEASTGVEYISNEVIIDGIYGGSGAISVTGGSYSIDGADFVTSSGTVSNGQKLRLKVTSSSEYSTTVEVKVTIGGSDFTYKVTTKADPLVEDSTPNSFDFGYEKDVQNDTNVTSSPVKITGITIEAPISITNGWYSLDGGNTWTNEEGSVPVDGNVTVRHTSASSFGTQTKTIVTIGGVTGYFSSFTVPEDKTPDSNVSFTDVKDVNVSTDVNSSSIVITGINTVVPVTIDNGSFDVNGSGNFVTEANITNGSSLRVKLTSSSDYEKEVVANLKVNNTIFTFRVKTMSDPDVADTTPDEFKFDTLLNQPKNTDVNSNTITVTGINEPATISVVNGFYKINDGAFTNQDGNVSKDDNITLQQTTADAFDTETITTLTIGGVSGTFKTVTAKEDKTPDTFSFDSNESVNPGATVTSNTVTITGINTDVDISVENGEFSLDGGITWNLTSTGTISNDMNLTIKHTAASDPETVTTTKVTVGTVTVYFTSKTLPEAPDIIGTPVETAVEDSLYTYTPELNSSAGSVDSWSIVNKPLWADFDPVSGRLEGVPRNEDVGVDTNVTIIATNAVGSDSISFDINVTNTNDAPVFNSIISDINVSEDSDAVSFELNVTDVDGDDLTFTATSSNSNLVDVSISGSTLTLTPLPNANGDADITVSVSDGNLSDSFTFTYTVVPVNDAPDILSDLRTAPINEDSNYFRVITIIDLDGDDFTFDANSSNTSIVTANITRLDTYYFQLDLNTTANANGQVTICVTADDGNTSTSKCFLLIINPVNDAPTISAIPDQSILEDSGSHSVDINVSDIDNNVSTLTVTAVSSDDSIVRVDANTSAVTFTTVDDAYGDVNITVTVSDGDLNASTTFGVHVENIPESVSGRVMVDDYVANAKLYVYDDILRKNLIASGTTDENGNFDIVLPSQYEAVPYPLYIHSVGGTIKSSAMIAPNMDIITYSSYPNNITPLTTLVNDWYFNYVETYSDLSAAIYAVESQTHIDASTAIAYEDTTFSYLDVSLAMQRYILNGNFMTSTLPDGNYTMSMLSFDKGDIRDVNISDVEDLESRISTYAFSVSNGVIQGSSDDSISGVVSGTTVVLDINKTDGSFVSIAGSVGLFGSSSGVSSLVESDGTTKKGFFIAQFVPEDITDSQKSMMKENLLLTVNCPKDFVYRISIGDMVKTGIGSLTDLANEDGSMITFFENDINITEGDGRLDFADFDSNESRFMLNGDDITSFATRVFNLHDGNSSSDSLQAKIYLIQPIGVRKALVIATDPSSGEIVGIGNSYISTQGVLALPNAGIYSNSTFELSIAKVDAGMIGKTKDNILFEQTMELNTTDESNTSKIMPVLSALRVQPDSEQNSTDIALLSGSVLGIYNDTNQNDLNDTNDSMNIVQFYQNGAFDTESIVGGVLDDGRELRNYPGVLVGSIYEVGNTNKIFVKNPFMSTLNFVMRPLYVDDTSKLGKILYGTITPPYGEDATLSIEGQNSVNLYNSFDFASGMYHIEGTLNDGTYIDIMWPTGGKKAVYAISDSDDSDANIIEVGEVYLSF